jgi:hypothetical protein
MADLADPPPYGDHNLPNIAPETADNGVLRFEKHLAALVFVAPASLDLRLRPLR